MAFFTPLLLAAVSGHAAPDMSYFWDNMDTPGKIIVGILVAASFWGWGAMIGKWVDISSTRKRNLGYELRLRNVATILSLESVRSPNLCPYEYLAFEAVQAFKKHRSRIRTAEDIALCMGHVENAIQRGIARNVQKYEEKLIFISSLVSGGPFLGLLGTVWGVMLTFGALGTSEHASIKELAPGVSGALVATTFGLLVAIPATFGYNFLLSHTKVMTTELENFASSLADRIELELQESARRNRERSSGRAPESRDALYPDEGDDLLPPPAYEASRATQPAYEAPAPSRRPSAYDEPRAQSRAPFEPIRQPIPGSPVARPQRSVPSSSDFGPDAAHFDEGDTPPSGQNRLREARDWDEVR